MLKMRFAGSFVLKSIRTTAPCSVWPQTKQSLQSGESGRIILPHLAASERVVLLRLSSIAGLLTKLKLRIYITSQPRDFTCGCSDRAESLETVNGVAA